MSAQADRVKAIFLEATEKHAPEEWPVFLEQACPGDAALRAEVERLLRARAELGSFHEPPRPVLAQTVDEPVRERLGTVIGPYKLIQEVGEGGMGAVWMAQQTEPVKRLVALKVIKPGMDSRQVIARFEAERQALALMDHPNIARVFDAGTTSAGRPYFVMKLVKGVPLTKYCDERRLTPRERLDCSSRCARRFSTRTRRASSTGISSLPTCWLPFTTGNPCQRSSTLGLPRRPGSN